MSKQSGLGANLYLGSFDLSGDVGMISSISAPRSIVDVTPINATASVRLLAKRDGNLSFTGFWNTTIASGIVDVLDAFPSTDMLASVAIPASTSFAVGDVGCSVNGKQITFDQSRGNDGSLAVTTQIQSNGSALEWGRLLTAGLASVATGAVNGTAVDDSASTAFGGAFYLHVTAMASGTMSLKIQDSADNSTFADLSGAAFTDVTAPTSQRIVLGTGATVRRYVRLVTSGTHATATMAVLFVRYQTSQAI